MLSGSFKRQPLSPATLLALWMLVVLLAMNFASPYGIYLSVIVAIVANTYAPSHFHRLLKRSRWLLLSVTLIFIFMTPGVALVSIAGVPAPSADGLRAAIDQFARLVLALAMLALLLSQMDLNELIAGLRQLLMVLHLPGFDHDRAALRLSLTLCRLEQGHQRTKPQYWQSRFEINADIGNAPRSISLRVYPFGTLDKLIIAIALISFVIIVVAGQTLPSGRFKP